MAAIPVPSVNTPTYQSWGAAVAGKLNTFTVTTLNPAPTTDAWGYSNISAASLGLSTVTGAVVSIQNDPGAPDTIYFVGAVRVVGTSIGVQLCSATVAANDINIFANNPSFKLSVVAWGTVA